MSKTSRSGFKEDSADTADSYYSPPQAKGDPWKLQVGTLVVHLNAKKT